MKSTGFFLKSHCDYLQYPLQVDMNNVVKCRKDFFAYFNALETRGEVCKYHRVVNSNKAEIAKINFSQKVSVNKFLHSLKSLGCY